MSLDGNKFQRCQALPYSKEPTNQRRCASGGHFIVTGPDIEPLKFESGREARDWCAEPHPGSPIQEIGADAVKRETKVKAVRRAK
jgi:hypothetical protein